MKYAVLYAKPAPFPPRWCKTLAEAKRYAKAAEKGGYGVTVWQYTDGTAKAVRWK